MGVIFILIVASLFMAVAFLFAFIWAVRNGQYEDTCTPSLRLLVEEDAGLRITTHSNESTVKTTEP